MNRRAFAGGVAACVTSWPRRARGQADRQVRVGWLSTGRHPFIEAFRQELRDLSYVEGRNLVIEERYAEGQPERLPVLARELIGIKVDIVVASGGAAARAARGATNTLPLVCIAGDLLWMGLVNSLAHPGGNVTGLSYLGVELNSKRLQMLKELIPTLRRVAVLVPSDHPMRGPMVSDIEGTARVLGLSLQLAEVTTTDPVEK